MELKKFDVAEAEVEAKFNEYTDAMMVMLWNNFCTETEHTEDMIFENNEEFFAKQFDGCPTFELMELVCESEGYTTNEDYVTIEQCTWYSDVDILLASSNKPIELMQLNNEKYGAFLNYCAEKLFK